MLRLLKSVDHSCGSGASTAKLQQKARKLTKHTHRGCSRSKRMSSLQKPPKGISIILQPNTLRGKLLAKTMQVNMTRTVPMTDQANLYLDFLTTLLYNEITSVGPAAKL